MDHIIEVDLLNGELITALEDNPREEVAREDTVIWQFKGNAAGQGLRVVESGPSPFDGAFLQSQPDQISGLRAPNKTRVR